MLRKFANANVSRQSLFSTSDYSTARFNFSYPLQNQEEHYYYFHDMQRIMQRDRLKFAKQYITARLCGGYSDGIALVAATLPYLAKSDAKNIAAAFSDAPALFNKLYPIKKLSGKELVKDIAGRYQLALAIIPLIENTDQKNQILTRLDSNHWDSFQAKYREWHQSQENKDSAGYRKHT